MAQKNKTKNFFVTDRRSYGMFTVAFHIPFNFLFIFVFGVQYAVRSWLVLHSVSGPCDGAET